MTVVFCTLCAQMTLLLLLVLPLPHIIRTKIVDIAMTLDKSSYFKTGVWFWTTLMTMQVVDCVQRLQRFTGSVIDNPYYASDQSSKAKMALTQDQLASKFYAQRNLYISGAVLYLMVSIFTVLTIVKKMVLKQKAIRNFKPSASNEEEIEKYTQLLKMKQQDIDTLKKQIAGLQKSYDGLTDSKVSSTEKKND